MDVDEKKSHLIGEKTIALCVTGSVAAVKSVKLARELRRLGADVTPYMTRGSREILHSNAMEFATGKKPVTSLSGALEHLRTFDLVIVAPVTANTISKIAHGIADNPVTSLVLSTKSNVILAPSMHQEMYTCFTLSPKKTS
jgi:phosphopantothenoylcysteine decarboxylase/phosphopantothenate--cysteine ligase